MMSKLGFPQAMPDGSFCVSVSFDINSSKPNDLADRIQDWIVAWVKSNHIWERQWSNGEIDHLLFEDEFLSAPILTSCTTIELVMRFRGYSASSKIWKDWIILKITPELTGDFPEIRSLSRITNCD